MPNYKDYLVSKTSEQKDVSNLRSAVGLPPIDQRNYPCARCKKEFLGEYKNNIKLIWYCDKCTLSMNRGTLFDGHEDSFSAIENDFQ